MCWNGQAWVHALVCPLLLVRQVLPRAGSVPVCFAFYVRLYAQSSIWQGLPLWIYGLCLHKSLHSMIEMRWLVRPGWSLQNSLLWNTKNKALALLFLWDGKTAVRRDQSRFAAVVLGHRLKAVACVWESGLEGGDGEFGNQEDLLLELFTTWKLSLT